MLCCWHSVVTYGITLDLGFIIGIVYAYICTIKRSKQLLTLLIHWKWILFSHKFFPLRLDLLVQLVLHSFFRYKDIQELYFNYWNVHFAIFLHVWNSLKGAVFWCILFASALNFCCFLFLKMLLWTFQMLSIKGYSINIFNQIFSLPCKVSLTIRYYTEIMSFCRLYLSLPFSWENINSLFLMGSIIIYYSA